MPAASGSGRSRSVDMTEERPAWFARREIAPFTLGDDDAQAIVNTASPH